jgi:ribonuclease P protein component
MRNTFCKEERLNKVFFSEILKNGKKIYYEEFILIWKKTNQKVNQRFPLRLGISVPKKNFPRSVDRNLIKRKIKEGYRSVKNFIYNNINTKLQVILIYNSKRKPYIETIVSLKAIFNILIHQLND